MQTLKKLVLRGVDVDCPDYDGVRALHLAADAGLLSTVLHLIEAGAEVNVKDRWGRTPLTRAAQKGHDIVVRALQQHGGKLLMPYREKAELLFRATRDNQNDYIRMLLMCDIDVNLPVYDIRAPLHAAALYGNLTALKFFLQAGARPNTLDSWHRTPLQIAVERSVNWVGPGREARQRVFQEIVQVQPLGPHRMRAYSSVETRA